MHLSHLCRPPTGEGILREFCTEWRPKTGVVHFDETCSRPFHPKRKKKEKFFRQDTRFCPCTGALTPQNLCKNKNRADKSTLFVFGGDSWNRTDPRSARGTSCPSLPSVADEWYVIGYLQLAHWLSPKISHQSKKALYSQCFLLWWRQLGSNQ